MLQFARIGPARRWAGLVFLLAVALWALTPVGVMPTRGATGEVTFALCTGDGPVMVQYGTDGQPHPVTTKSGAQDAHPCPYAAASLLARTEATLLPVPGGLAAARSVDWPGVRLVLPDVPHVRPQSRGPPILT